MLNTSFAAACRALLLPTAVLAGFAAHAADVSLTVPAVSDIWLAGQPDGTIVIGEFGGDQAPQNSPVAVAVSAGSTLFFSASGSTSVDGSCFAGPDGGCYADESSFGTGPENGVGMYKGPATALIGVFVAASQPTGTDAPASIDYTVAANQALTTFSPALGQVFFIGDGLTGSGSGETQHFIAPAGATRLFLAVADSLGSSTGNSGNLTVKVTDLVTTTTTLRATPLTAPAGAKISLTAMVTPPPGSPAPTGTVDFTNAGVSLGSATLNGTGQATLTTTALPVGAHAVRALYAGSATEAKSTSAPVTVTITNAVATSTSLVATPSTAAAGTSVTFKASVPPLSGSGTPTGFVIFKNGTAGFGSVALSGGTASISTTKLSVGAHQVTAVYVGSLADKTSTSNAVTVTIDPAPTTTTLAASPITAGFGTAVGLTASVKPVAGTTLPTGYVMFMNGTTTFGAAAIDGATGVAIFSATKLPVGSHALTAVYHGNATDLKSTSSAVTVIVEAGATTTRVAASPTSAYFGASITLTATVKPVAGGATPPAGYVMFMNGTTAFGAAPIDGATGVATFAATKLPVGTLAVTAVYHGNTSYRTSTSSAVSVSVGAAPTTTTLMAAPATAAVGTSVTLTATVQATVGSVVPRGVVTFKLGTTTLGRAALTNGSAVLSTSKLPSGSDSITATYGGTTDDQSSTSVAQGVTIT